MWTKWNVEILDRNDELRIAVELGHRRAPVVAIEPMTAKTLKEATIAAIGPAILDLGGGRPGIGSHPPQNLLDIDRVPGERERFNLGHGDLP
jgi:hypothetical protein